MKSNSKNFMICGLCLAILVCLCGYSCGNGENGSDKTDSTSTKEVLPPTKEDLPLNVSVYLDLSDRLTREIPGASQVDRDTAIINHLVDIIYANVKRNKILNSKDNFQIFFYPTPNNSDIAAIAKNLQYDFGKFDKNEKKVKLKEMKAEIDRSMKILYDEALQAGNWDGSDIWGFFSNKKVDEYCIRKGYRNIIVILTDGYLFHKDNKQNNGAEYSYILPRTLAVENSSLIVKRDGLTDLEVMVLEVNPYDPKQRDPIEEKIKTWFLGMGVPEDHFVLAETDESYRIEHVIDNFFKK